MIESQKYYSDTAWNFGSFTIQAFSGLLLTLSLMQQAGPEALGVFNQLYAVFVITGQVAAFSLHDSCQKHVSQHFSELNEKNHVVKAGLLAALITGMIGAGVLFLLSLIIEHTPLSLRLEHLLSGSKFLAGGIILFVLNKVGLAILNGEKRMRLYALIHALRSVLVVTGALIVIWLQQPLSYLGMIFGASELIISIGLAASLRPYFASSTSQAKVSQWIRYHFSFGLRGLPHGIFTETFIRVDILVLSLFMSAAQVGVYSFVAFFIEGIFQIPVMVRTVTNPRWVGIIIRRNLQEMTSLTVKSSLISGGLTGLAAVFLISIFPEIIQYFSNTHPHLSQNLLKLLLGGLVIYSFFVPLEHLLLQAGKPGLQSIYMTIITGINLILNFILIPKLDLTGAAWATASTFALAGPLVCLMAYLALEIKHWQQVKHV